MVSSTALKGPALHFAHAERWSRRISRREGYVLRDPITLDPYSPDTPPSWITDEAILANGLKYLRQNAQRIQLTIILGRHELAQDLGDLQTGWFETQVKNSDFYGYESPKHTTETTQLMQRYAEDIVSDVRGLGRPLNPTNTLESAKRLGYGSSYQTRQLVAATQLGTFSFPMDYRSDGTSVERTLIDTYPRILGDRNRSMAALANVGHTSAREWIGVARLGAELSDQFGPLHTLISGVVTFGSMHEDIRRKLSLQGVMMQITAHLSDEEYPLSPPLQTGVVGRTEMPRLIELANEVRDHIPAI